MYSVLMQANMPVDGWTSTYTWMDKVRIKLQEGPRMVGPPGSSENHDVSTYEPVYISRKHNTCWAWVVSTGPNATSKAQSSLD